MTHAVDVDIAIRNLVERTNKASSYFREWARRPEWEGPSWFIESCFLQLLAFTESLGLLEFRKMVLAEYQSVKQNEQGFCQ